MTTAEQFRDAVAGPTSTVSIAGVPWPAYKVVALLVGLLAFAVVGVATTTVGTAVLSGAGAATLLWIGLGRVASLRS